MGMGTNQCQRSSKGIEQGICRPDELIETIGAIVGTCFGNPSCFGSIGGMGCTPRQHPQRALRVDRPTMYPKSIRGQDSSYCAQTQDCFGFAHSGIEIRFGSISVASHYLQLSLQRVQERFYGYFCGGSVDIVETCWRTVTDRRDPRLRWHPMCKVKNWMRRAIPISLHADAVPCVAVGKSGTRSFEVHSWQSILGKGSNRQLKQYIFGMFLHSMADRTMTECWKVLIWSLNVLFNAVWPFEDHLGIPYSQLSSEYNLASSDNNAIAGSSADESFLRHLVVEGRLGLSYEGVVLTKLQRK